MVSVGGGAVTLDHLRITNGSSNNGGGILNSGTLTLSNSTVTGNTANTGAGIYNWFGPLTIVDSTISGNTATSIGGGGGIFTGGRPVTITRSTLSGNSASTGHGGGLEAYDNGSPITISDSTISGNYAWDKGGGLHGGNFTIVNSTFSGNSASFGGAIYNTVGAVRLTSSTISGNTGRGSVGGISNAGTVYLSSSILGPNNRGNCGGTSANFISVGHNLVDNGECNFSQDTDLTNTDPLLGALVDNGGPTLTMMPALTSPAVDKIPTGTTLGGVPVCPRADQRGMPGPISALTQCTIGAVEPSAWLAAQEPLVVTSTSGTFAQPLELTTSGGSGTGATTFEAANGTAAGCAVSPAEPYLLSSTSAGTCLVTATKAADADFRQAFSPPTTVTIGKAEQDPLAITSTSAEFAVDLELKPPGGPVPDWCRSRWIRARAPCPVPPCRIRRPVNAR
ncbi:MAG: hypothetical protein IPL43_02295 [Micropruina sp.]|nr:hypothetical protein [Micropruina sp.]